MKSVMKHRFSEVPKADIRRSSFDRSHGMKTTFDASYLIPIYYDEALPGDTASVNMTGFARLATPIHPIMDNIKMSTFFFEVPVRLLWDNWTKFMGEQENPGDDTDFLIPQITAPEDGYPIGSIYDYFGLPTDVGGYSHSALPLRAYNKIYNDWFRDQNLQESVDLPKDDGPDLDTTFTLLRRGKRHDYFTSCLPWPQKDNGNPVLLPLGDSAPVSGTVDLAATGDWSWTDGSGTCPISRTTGDIALRGSTGVAELANLSYSSGLEATPTDFEADLTNATAATINELRQAFQIQKLFERDARGGTRYIEIIKAHYNVNSPDLRLQRSGYLGGGISYVNINPVPQTSSTGDSQGPVDTPQGNLSAYGTATMNRHGFSKSFTEHTILIGLLSVQADLTYQQGLERSWSRRTKYDFYWPALAQIGEQAVLNKEIFTQGTAQDEDVFGYQEVYAEYRYKPSIITGQFRSTASESLDAWHLSQEFASLPTLSSQFIEDDAPLDRVIAVTDEPHFIFDSYFKSNWARPMPLYGVPGLIDHF
jgi:hypothetical protein